MKLVELTKAYAIDFTQWISDKSAIEFSLSLFQDERNVAWVSNYIDQLLRDQKAWNRVIIYDGNAIGYCGLTNISKNNKSAEYFILIGDKQYWNHGLGTRAGLEVLGYAFGVIGLHRVWLSVSVLNYGAIRSYEKIGFKKEGVLRDGGYRNGKYYDKIIMSQ